MMSKRIYKLKRVVKGSQENLLRSRSALERLESRQMLAAHILGSSTSYATIQAAVTAASVGATITVDAGTYNEEVFVNKQLNIRGAMSGIDARTRSTTGESIIDGATGTGSTSASFYVSASDVTLDGFTVQGETSQSATVGAGIVLAPGISGTHIINDIIQNNVAGIYLTNSSSTDPAVMQYDLFQNNNNAGTNGGRGIYTDGGITNGNLTNVVIDSNTFYNNHGTSGTTYCEAGIAFESANPGQQSNITITNNTFTSNGKAVLFFNTTNLVFQGNTVSGQTDSAGTVRFEGGDSNVSIAYNTITNNGGTGIAIDSKGVAYPDSNFTIEYNNFVNNSADWGDAMSVIAEADDYNGALTAINNWWNSTTGPGGVGPGTGDKIYGNGYWSSGHQWAELTGGTAVFSPWASALINISSIPVPAAPVNVTASILSSTSIQLTWTLPFSTATSEQVQRSSDGVNFTTIATVAPQVSSYTDSALPALAYYYRVIGVNSTGSSAASNVASTLPTAPSQLKAVTISSTQINLNWTDNAAGIENGFIIQRSTDGVNFTQINTVGTGVTTYADTSAVAGTTYYYRVAATAVSGNSVFSGSATATSIAASSITAYLTSLNWTSATAGYGSVQKNLSVNGNAITLKGTVYPSGLSANAVSNIVYHLAGGYSNFLATIGIDDEELGKGVGSVDFQLIGDGTVLYDSGVLTSASPAVNINVSVAGVQTLTLVANNGVAGTIDYDQADWAGARLVTSAALALVAPSNLAAVANSATQINLNWNSTAVNATGFVIQRSTDGTNFTTIATLTTASNASYSDSTVVASTVYYYQVLAVGSGLTSVSSNVASVTTLSAAAVTTNLTALTWVSAAAGYGSVQKNVSVNGNAITLKGVVYPSGISANAVSTIVYNLAGGYTNFLATVGIDDEELTKGTGSVDFQVIGDGKVLYDSGVLTNSSPAVNINLSVAGVQTLSLVANNGVAGTIDFDHADWAGARLLSIPQLPLAPVGLVAVTSSSSQINLSWYAPAGTAVPTGYTVQRSTDGVNFTTLASLGNVTIYFDKTALASTAYTYRVLSSNKVGNSAASVTASATTLSALAVVTNLSSLAWVSATTGWGSVQANSSVAGNTITLRGVTYATGLGAHAVSNIVYKLNGVYTNFISDVGVDDEENSKGIGSVDFQIIGDGKVLFDSGVLTNNSSIVSLNVNVMGVQQLTLSATNGVANSIDYDHADWAGARLVSASTPVAVVSAQLAPASSISSVAVIDAADTAVASLWSNTSIGNSTQPGSALESGSSITVTGAGNAVARTVNSVDYAYQSLTGDGTIVAHLDSTQTGTDEAGIMMRGSLSATAPELSMVFGNKTLRLAKRHKSTSKTTTTVTKINPKAVERQWMKMVRKDKTITAYDSADGVHWRKVGSAKLKLNETVDVGLISTAGNSNLLNTAVFSSVVVTPKHS